MQEIPVQKKAQSPLTAVERRAYRNLLYWAMLDIRILCQARGQQSQNPFTWFQRYKEGRVAGMLADWLHNLAQFAASDFYDLDRERFWNEYEYLCERIQALRPGGWLDYKKRFEDDLGRFAQAMKETHCPLCYDLLKVKDVAPCMCCGDLDEEVEQFKEGRHTFAEYRVLDQFELVLCDFCHIDFGSIQPSFFRLTKRLEPFKDIQYVSDAPEPCITKDKFCPTCGYRLPFLNFVAGVREMFGTNAHET